MNFYGLSADKRSLYTEMKIFIRKKYSTTFSTKPIYKTIVQNNLDASDENVLMSSHESPAIEPLSFYFTLKSARQNYYSKLTKARSLITARVKNTFNATKAQDNEIERSLDECFRLVKSFESGLKGIPAVADSGQPHQLITAIRLYLTSELARMTKDLKKEEQKFFSKLRENISNNNNSSFDFITEQHIDDSKRVVYNERGEKMVLTEIGQQHQNEEVVKIVGQINGLTQLLGQMNEMVLEQGTIVDRVDFNLQLALGRTQKGNIELFKAKEELEKGCAAKLLRILVIANIAVFLMILLKFK